MGQDENAVAMVVRRLREVLSIPIIAKLTPEGGCIAEVSKAAFEAGADAVSSVANRLGIPSIDIWNYRKPIYNLQVEATLSMRSVFIRSSVVMANEIFPSGSRQGEDSLGALKEPPRLRK